MALGALFVFEPMVELVATIAIVNWTNRTNEELQTPR